MTQVGESISVALEMAKQYKCMICGQSHADPKRDEIEPTAGIHEGWQREDMSAVRDNAKNALYPNGRQNHPPYTTEGHHCLALSSFVFEEPEETEEDDKKKKKKATDVCAQSNYFMRRAGFKPNDEKNIIHLPDSKDSLFEFIEAERPLQPHTGKHPKKYFTASNLLVQKAISLAQRESTDSCEMEDLSGYLDRLRTLMDQAVNYAYVMIVGHKWLVQKATTYRRYIAGYKGKKPLPPPWQTITPEPDVGPFKKR